MILSQAFNNYALFLKITIFPNLIVFYAGNYIVPVFQFHTSLRS